MFRIGLATTCRGRLQHLRETLPRNLAHSKSYPNAVFVVLCYGDIDGTRKYLKSHHAGDIASGRLVVYYYENEPWHIAKAKNIAARCAIREGAEILVTLDADNFTGAGFLEFIADAFQERTSIFLCPNYQLIKSMPHGAARPPRGYAGRLVVFAQTFLKMGGYNEIFAQWGMEDIDSNFRLQRMGYAMRYIPNQYLNAINHSAAVRFAEYPEAQKNENPGEVERLKARTDTVVNQGHFGCGRVQRNFGNVFELKPIPTRIFGIGLQKTGTSSLHAAFQHLGFDSFHWGKGEAPLIWYETKALGQSPTLEQFYALSDLPIPLLYKELDAAYPGSKFILTVRNDVDWLVSVSRLWDPKFNKTRHLWDIYPFTNTIHTELYGQKDFDALVFLARYRRHTMEVMEYFADRPDLLVLDISADPWGKLCRFLNVDKPNIPFPRENVTRLINFATF